MLPSIAAKAMGAGQRMLVVAGDEALRERLDRELWAQGAVQFLAHGKAGEPHEARQPILLSATCDAPNEARLVALADGQWRDEAENFDRALLFFDDSGREAARTAWRRFDERDDVEREFFEFEDGGWRKKL